MTEFRKEKKSGKKSDKKRTQGHQLLGKLLKLLLEPLGISVSLNRLVMVAPPEADIVLIRNETNKNWSPEQLLFLPDGIRECQSEYILIEFKYSQSFNKMRLLQSLTYDYHFLVSNELQEEDLQTFLVCSRTPRKKSLESFGYKKVKPGVYTTNYKLLDRIVLIVSNELENTPYNAAFKVFASNRSERQKAIQNIRISWLGKVSEPVVRLISGLWNQWF